MLAAEKGRLDTVAVLLPVKHAEKIREGLTDYLKTTFAFADNDAQESLQSFLEHRESGMFKGPFLRTRLPFAPSQNPPDMSWYGDGFTPYGHQADAFHRLTSLGEDGPRRPQPTLVTTGTGSGKTEAFLFPVLEHVLRAQQRGEQGIKALILYPMNALAGDQADRLTKMITQNRRLSTIQAGIYTGEAPDGQTQVTADGLISNRKIMRDTPPDILLTNYKMLDQLLLRPEDRKLWELSAHSLQYLVLDEFHTYDGAQGTDVAMLLRRLGLVLKQYWREGDSRYSEADRARPLGVMTPVATSATLGDDSDSSPILDFAETVFGEPFPADAVVTESRLDLESWLALFPAPKGLFPGSDGSDSDSGVLGSTGQDVALLDFEMLYSALGTTSSDEGFSFDGLRLTRFLVSTLWPEHSLDIEALSTEELAGAFLAHPLTKALVAETATPVHLRDLCRRILPAGIDSPEEQTQVFVHHLFAALGFLRSQCGRSMPSTETHLWVRELSRINRVASATAIFAWSDDGRFEDGSTAEDASMAAEDESSYTFPAFYCRKCGRSGWGVTISPANAQELARDQDDMIRKTYASKQGYFRALLSAPKEAEAHADPESSYRRENLRWFHVANRTIQVSPPHADDPHMRAGHMLPVLMHVDDDAEDLSRGDVCPCCGTRDSIRPVGSAVSTMLSVSLSVLFNDKNLDRQEKNALVFTDSVQDAAHRSGYVTARSHTTTLRSVIFEHVDKLSNDSDSQRVSLDSVCNSMVEAAGDDGHLRYRLVHPSLVQWQGFVDYWQGKGSALVQQRHRKVVSRRLLFDLVCESGLQSHFGRTLERTNTVAPHVAVDNAVDIARSAVEACRGVDQQALAGSGELGDLCDDPDALRSWVRGVLERVRTQGGIHHEWLDKYIASDCQRWAIWGGRDKSGGMPAFPRGRSAPTFPRVGERVKDVSKHDVDVVNSERGWYAMWSARRLRVDRRAAARFVVELFEKLSERGVLTKHRTDSKGSIFSIPSSGIELQPVPPKELLEGERSLRCDVCHDVHSGTAETIKELAGSPCMILRCQGTLEPLQQLTNFYRELYRDANPRRVIAHEHTSLLESAERVKVENAFKSGAVNPGEPNVLVATPTLEMGIDIGDLSTVMLASLPRSVASYLQRVGRAGRLTGSSLNLVYVKGRGENLPKLHNPLEVVDGLVRPPATYLSADEILRRQFIAHLADLLAITPGTPNPKKASAAMPWTQDLSKSLLGSLVLKAASDPHGLVDGFLAALPSVDEVAGQALRQWVAEVDPAHGMPGIEFAIRQASDLWCAELEQLRQRRKTIEAGLPELAAAAEAPTATNDDKTALGSALAARRMLDKQQENLRTVHWVSALEQFGLLPNYTLLGDNVALDVQLSWIDPETGKFKTEDYGYQRDASTALQEFSPGSTFYASGMEIEIDSVDLGPDEMALCKFALCPCCGFSVDMLQGGVLGAPTQCPRCLSRDIADTSQHFDVVKLTKVSAQVRRDEATITDTSEDRKNKFFSIVPAADINPETIDHEWYLPGFDFGVKHARQMTIRWFNLGEGHSAQSREIAGHKRAGRLFRVCAKCGHLDSKAGTNSEADHKPWCVNRKSRTEDNHDIALYRELTTQAVVLLLPRTRTRLDQNASVSIAAALKFGLREHFGGSPDHIDIISTTVPTGQDPGEVQEGLLLHDTVPGGTGYLAELKKPHEVRDLLYTAWDRLRQCECAETSRVACHACLLPMVRSSQAHLVSRETAVACLREILTLGNSEAEPDPTAQWQVEDKPSFSSGSESQLEQDFRFWFKEQVEQLGGSVSIVEEPRGQTLDFSLAGQESRWKLRSQVDRGGCRPDFVLTNQDPSVPAVCIFTDGFEFHASPEHNRVADDFGKRAALRGSDIVLSITYADVHSFGRPVEGSSPVERWFSDSILTGLNTLLQLPPIIRDALPDNNLRWLILWLQDPNGAWVERLALASAAVSMMYAVQHGTPAAGQEFFDHFEVENLERSVNFGLWSMFYEKTPGGTYPTWVVLRDDEDAVRHPGFKQAWQEVLALSNRLSSTPHHRGTLTTSQLREERIPGVIQPGFVSALPAPRDGGVGAASGRAVGPGSVAASTVDGSSGETGATTPEGGSDSGSALSAEFAALIDDALDELERDVLRRIAQVPGVAVPLVGEEFAGGVAADVSWAEYKMAGLLSGQSIAEKGTLEAAGWTVCTDIDELVETLRESVAKDA